MVSAAPLLLLLLLALTGVVRDAAGRPIRRQGGRELEEHEFVEERPGNNHGVIDIRVDGAAAQAAAGGGSWEDFVEVDWMEEQEHWNPNRSGRRSLYNATRDSSYQDLQVLRDLIQQRADLNVSSNSVEACTDPADVERIADIMRLRQNEWDDPDRFLVGACARHWNEAHILPEWLAFHYVAGVDHMMIMDDNSDDDWLATLQPFVEAGWVEVFNASFNPKASAHVHQMAPVNFCIERFRSYSEVAAKEGGKQYGWIVQVDLDEFVMPLDLHSTIGAALAHHNDVGCLYVPRCKFGARGHLLSAQGLIVETYFHHAYQSRFDWPKVFPNLQSPPGWEPFPYIKNMHLMLPNKKWHALCRTMENRTTFPEPGSEKARGLVRINHYLRSMEEYIVKIQTSWASTKHSGESPSRPIKWIMTQHNPVKGESTKEITHWACAVKKLLLDYKVKMPLPIPLQLPEHLECIVDNKSRKRICVPGYSGPD